MVLGKIITDSNADLTSLAAIDGDKGRLGGIVVKDRVRFVTILGTETTGCFATDGLIDMRNKIQGISPLV